MSKWRAFYETFRNEHLQQERKSDCKPIEVEEGTYKRLYKDTSLGRRSWNVQVSLDGKCVREGVSNI